MSLAECLLDAAVQANCDLLTIADVDMAVNQALSGLFGILACDEMALLKRQVNSTIKSVRLQHFWSTLPALHWQDWFIAWESDARLQQGRAITISEQTALYRLIPVFLPLPISCNLWGVLRVRVSCDDDWTLVQDQALTLVATHLGIALQRQVVPQIPQPLEQSRFQHLLETIADLIWEVDVNGAYTYMSPQVEKILGYHPDELLGQTMCALMPASSLSTKTLMQRYVAQRCSFAQVEVTRCTKTGQTVIFESSGVPFFDAQGRFQGYRGVDRDVTQQKTAEVELYHQHCLIELRAIVDSILARNIPLAEMLEQCTAILVQQLNVGVVRLWTLDPVSQMLELQASSGYCKDTDNHYERVPLGDLAVGTIAQQRSPLLTNDVQSEPQIQHKEWALKTGMNAFAGYPLIVGDELVGVIVLFSQQNLSDDTLEMLAFIAGEIAEGIRRKQSEVALAKSEAKLRRKAEALKLTLGKLRKTQAQLVQSEKMSSLGQLVAGIAHEINNPVNFIQGNVRYSQDYFQNLLQAVALYQQEYRQPSSSLLNALDDLDLPFIQRDLPKVLESMEMGADRIQSIVSTLKVFACLDESGVKPIDVQAGIDSALAILRSRLGHNQAQIKIAIERDYGDVAIVNGLVGHLNQVFMNLIANAIDALHEAVNQQLQLVPKIWIRTRQLNASQIAIEISDNAGGMSETVKKQIFDPFFTTKPIGQGTGLGLSTCYQIVVNEHGGKIHCESQLGEGTKFILYLPTAAIALTAAS